MVETFAESLRSWQNFYFMAGGAAASLLGLMFVALSLGMNVAITTSTENIENFTTPSIVYFVSTLLISCVMLIPAFSTSTLSILLFIGGAIGFGINIQHVIAMIRTAKQYQDFGLLDFLFQIGVPPLGYLLILASAICFAATQWSLGFGGLWLAAILLLLSAITNTWSLVLWIIDQRQK